jgi:hypothetical protein
MRISKRLIKRIAIGIGVAIGLLLIVNGILAWTAQRRLDQKIAELRDSGEKASLADLAPKPVPPQRNAAAFLQEIAPQLKDFEARYSHFYATRLGASLDDESLATAEQRTAMKAILDAFPAILPTLSKAAACDRYASLIDYSPPASQVLESVLKEAQAFRTPARFVGWKMAVSMADGKSDEAIPVGVRMLRITRLYDQEPTLMSHLVCVAVRGIIFDSMNKALRRNEISRSVRAELDAELALHDSFEPVKSALGNERAVGIGLVAEQTGGIAMLFRWPLMNWMLGELDAEDQAYRLSGLPLEQIRPQWDPTSKQVTMPNLASIRSRLITPAIEANFVAEFRTLVQCRCLRVVNALGEYRPRTGKDVVSIEQLSLPREAIIDPCTGKSLRMTKTNAGWIVYSVYRNGEDDGGKYHPNDGPWGFGPPGYEREETK